MRIGHGFDVHAFGGEGPLIIGGVRIPYEKGLLAHSDGDVGAPCVDRCIAWRGGAGGYRQTVPGYRSGI
ncbi:2-C-methyl-D-erythritol 2,4-cyclo diphosphate synthase [Escherichia coli]|nr:2-C-methyl-D-erythritol 2,4-cyclo diphosphate synthase [Escherichia coli]